MPSKRHRMLPERLLMAYEALKILLEALKVNIMIRKTQNSNQTTQREYKYNKRKVTKTQNSEQLSRSTYVIVFLYSFVLAFVHFVFYD